MELDIECIADEPEEPSLRRSQIFSDLGMAGEECHPMILSNIHSHERPTNRLALLKLRNGISDLKQLYFDLTEQVEDQRRQMRDFEE
jgi:hypothetical protein